MGGPKSGQMPKMLSNFRLNFRKSVKNSLKVINKIIFFLLLLFRCLLLLLLLFCYLRGELSPRHNFGGFAGLGVLPGPATGGKYFEEAAKRAGCAIHRMKEAFFISSLHRSSSPLDGCSLQSHWETSQLEFSPHFRDRIKSRYDQEQIWSAAQSRLDQLKKLLLYSMKVINVFLMTKCNRIDFTSPQSPGRDS
jgi:hypothetical protein